jgi:hypothetical protein
MRAKINTMRPDGTHRDDVFAEFARALETELAAVTKQRDELAAALRKLKEIAYPGLAYEIIETTLNKLNQ